MCLPGRLNRHYLSHSQVSDGRRVIQATSVNERTRHAAPFVRASLRRDVNRTLFRLDGSRRPVRLLRAFLGTEFLTNILCECELACAFDGNGIFNGSYARLVVLRIVLVLSVFACPLARSYRRIPICRVGALLPSPLTRDFVINGSLLNRYVLHLENGARVKDLRIVMSGTRYFDRQQPDLFRIQYINRNLVGRSKLHARLTRHLDVDGRSGTTRCTLIDGDLFRGLRFIYHVEACGFTDLARRRHFFFAIVSDLARKLRIFSTISHFGSLRARARRVKRCLHRVFNAT